MIIDPIVEELHRQREAYMERFHYDFDAVFRDIKAREALHATPPLEPPSRAESIDRPRRPSRLASRR